MPFLSYESKGLDKNFFLPDGKMVIVGREEHVDLQIVDDGRLSREHFGIDKDENGNYTLIELGASNGTSLNGEKLESNSITVLNDGDRISAGEQEFLFRKSLGRSSPSQVLNKISQARSQGKGYTTLLREIVGKRKK